MPIELISFDKGINRKKSTLLLTEGELYNVYGFGYKRDGILEARSPVEIYAIIDPVASGLQFLFTSTATITFVGDTGLTATASQGTFAGLTWTPPTTIDGQFVTVTFSDGTVIIGQLADLSGLTWQITAPTFLPVSGNYAGAIYVQILCSTPGVTIYYTIDGTDPTTASSEYTESILVTPWEELKAIAVKLNYTDSEIASSLYYTVLSTFITETDSNDFITETDSNNLIDEGVY